MRHVTRLGLFACVATAALLVGCKAGGRTEGTASATKTCADKSACTEGKTCSGTSAEAKKTCADKAAGCSEAKTCPATGKPMN
ncbi:MAG: hypothetical protein JNK35_10205 [Phycisphaerae bacterium]|nr:hypothetical protein [Phycisphaerae bacterium]